MTKRDILSLIILTAALMPSTTVADATLATPAADRCTIAVSAASDSQVKINAVRNRQIAALSQANLRLTGLLGQADAHHKNLPAIAGHQRELVAKTAALTHAYQTLSADVTRAGAQCGAPDAYAAAHTDLATVRAQVKDLSSWYHATLAPSLSGAGK